jgi:phage recombination protein Bet
MSTNNQLQKIEFSSDQVALIKSQIAPKATNDELKLFLYQAQRTGLDPLARQIYAIHRKQQDGQGNWVDKMTIQTSIDGFRVIAERSGVYAGQSEPEFTEDQNGLKCCKVRVFKFDSKGVRYEASVGVAYWSEYVQVTREGKPMGLWSRMPHTMLSKVAEALALRKAFPQDLSGIYTADEMQQADKPEEAGYAETVTTPKQNRINNTPTVTEPIPDDDDIIL